MPTPLESFMESLHKRRKCEESFQSRIFTHTTERFSAPDAEMKCELTLPDTPVPDHVSSLPAHTHTLEGFANTGVEMKCETKCEGSLTLPVTSLQPGDRISWTRGDLSVQHGVIDFLQTYPGEVWAFCALPDGKGTALNVKHIRKVEASC